jgi:hypothetical protein
MSNPTEVALTYEVEQKFAEAMPTRTLLMSEASTWLRHICEQEDLDVPHLDSHALPQQVLNMNALPQHLHPVTAH